MVKQVIIQILFFCALISCSEDAVIDIKPSDWQFNPGKESWETLSDTNGLSEVWHTGLPVVVVNTPNGQEITEKYAWLEGIEIKCFYNDSVEACGGIAKMRLHGNSSRMCDKKSYNLTFQTRTSVYNMPKHKKWILLANYYDKTLLRNELSFWLGRKFCDFEWTPRGVFVELIVNGDYRGNYFLCEQIRQDENRVKQGYVLEVDNKHASDDIIFKTSVKELEISIKDPDVELHSEMYYHIASVVDSVEKTLYGNKLLDKDCGYAKLVDKGSFADFYMINEIAKNVDALFYTSCFMNILPNDKLVMGPIWDLDIGYGNYVFPNPYTINEPTGLYMKASPWLERMFKDSDFVSIVAERTSRYVMNEDLIMDHIDMVAKSLVHSAVANSRRWNILTSSESVISDEELKEAYMLKVDSLKNWIHRRFNYLNSVY